MLTTIEILAKESVCRPLWLRYDGQPVAQSAHLYLSRDNTAYYRADPCLDNSVPEDVFNGAALQWRVPNDLTTAELEMLTEELLPYINTVIAGSELVWEDGKLKRSMIREARLASMSIEWRLSQTLNRDESSCGGCVYCHTYCNS